MGDHGITDAQARGHFAAWSDEDRYFPLDAELSALREAGFDESSASGGGSCLRSHAGCALADRPSGCDDRSRTARTNVRWTFLRETRRRGSMRPMSVGGFGRLSQQ